MTVAQAAGTPSPSASPLRRAGRWPGRALAPGGFLLLAVLFFQRLTLQGEVLFWGMPLLQFFPWRTFAVQEYLAGRIPLWNPYVGMGAPLVANLQSGVFYPLNFFYLSLPIERAMTVTLVLHVFLAGWFTYLYLRRVTGSTGAATISGCTFMFSGFVIAQGGFHNVVSTIAWVPGVLFCLESWLQRRTALWAAALAVSVAMVLLAGFIQTAYYGLILVAAYVLWRMRAERNSGGPRKPAASLLPGVAATGLALALGVALAAIQLLPAYELTRESVRQSGLDYADSTGYSLFPGQLVTVVAPTFFGSQPGGDWWGPGAPWEGVIYAGVLPFLLSLLAVARRGAAPAPEAAGFASLLPPRLFFALAGGAGLFLATGRYNPLFPFLWEHLPGLALFHAPSRFVLWYVLAVAVLAGIGWADLTRGPLGTGLKFGRLTAAAGAALLLLALAAGATLPDLPVAATAVPALTRGAIALLLGGVFIAAVAHLRVVRFTQDAGERALPADRGTSRPGWIRVATGAAVLLILVDLFLFGHGLNPSTDARLYAPQADVQPAGHEPPTGQARLFTTDRAYAAVVNRLFEFSRFHTQDWRTLAEMRRLLTPNLGTVEAIQEVHNYDPLKLHRSHRFRVHAEAAGLPEAMLLLSGTGLVLDVADGDQSSVTGRRRAAPPRAFLVTRVIPVATQEEAFGAIGGAAFDPLQQAVVEVPGAGAPAAFGAAGPRPATVVAYETQRVLVETDGAGGLLVLTDSHYPGWKAYVDGRDASILPTNAAFRGVFLAAGDRMVEFRYEPQSVRLGMAVSGIALILVVALTVAGLGVPRPWRAGPH